jgi:hypothetical protein
VHQYFGPSNGGKQPDLRGADYCPRAYRYITGLHVLSDAAHIRFRRHRADHGDPSRVGYPVVSIAHRHHRIRQRG